MKTKNKTSEGMAGMRGTGGDIQSKGLSGDRNLGGDVQSKDVAQATKTRKHPSTKTKLKHQRAQPKRKDR